MLTATELQAAWQGLRWGQPLHLFETIGSTNDYAKQQAEAGAPEGTVIWAEAQTAGRGRHGRRWLTPPGVNMALSLIVRPTLPVALAARLTMWAGLAVCEALEAQTPLQLALKWPNDVLLNGHKVGGILVEGATVGDQLDYAVVGIGLNVNWAPSSEAVDFPATSLHTALGQTVDRAGMARSLLHHLEIRYADLDSPELLRRWQERLVMMHEAVVAHTAEGPLTGWMEAVEADGALWLRLESGDVRRVVAGEVRLRLPQVV
jgi:BirA family biotin operon repressor/biotin-[acetyl-CoA-carboxylase] ligase